MTNVIKFLNVGETARIVVSTNGNIYYQKKHGNSYKNPIFIGQIKTDGNKLSSLVISTVKYTKSDEDTWICESQDEETVTFLNKYFKNLQINNKNYTLKCTKK